MIKTVATSMISKKSTTPTSLVAFGQAILMSTS
jgi:hypothetical protein